MPDDSGLLDGDSVSPHERFPTFCRNTILSSARVRQCKKQNISKEL